MPKDLISPRTRLEFREYFVGTSLAIVDDAFGLAKIDCDISYEPPISGARRGRVEQYYRTLDFARWDDVRRILVVYEHVMDEVERQVKFGDGHQKQWAIQKFDALTKCLERDGFALVGGRLVPSAELSGSEALHDAVGTFDAPELARQLSRLRDAVNQDPGLAIGTAKEMLETTCKTILEDLGVEVDPSWEIPTLLKETRKLLKLLPEDVPSAAKGADTIRRLLSNLGQVAQGLAELRNYYGSGHGRSGKTKGLSPRHARLAVGSVATLVQFLFETHQEHEKRRFPKGTLRE